MKKLYYDYSLIFKDYNYKRIIKNNYKSFFIKAHDNKKYYNQYKDRRGLDTSNIYRSSYIKLVDNIL